jgi:hypothetical protein
MFAVLVKRNEIFRRRKIKYHIYRLIVILEIAIAIIVNPDS